MRKWTIILLALAFFAFNACSVDDAAESLLTDYDPLTNQFARAWVGADNLTINVPGSVAVDRSSSGGFSALITSVGAQSEFYEMTYEMSLGVNGHIRGTLSLIDEIIAYPPTSQTATQMVWGPGADPLDPFVAMFTMTLVGDDSYEYELSAAPKDSEQGEDDFLTLVDGTLEEVRDARKSKGTMNWYVDGISITEPENTEATGSLIVDFDLTDTPQVIEVEFVDFNSGDGTMPENLNAYYYYEQDEDGAGLFSFATTADIVDFGTAPESISLISRWDSNGAGRGDAIVSSGDLLEVTIGEQHFENVNIRASECWSDLFSTTYTLEEIYDDTALIDSTEIGDATACVFTEGLFE
jgi:hypothetical protein